MLFSIHFIFYCTCKKLWSLYVSFSNYHIKKSSHYRHNHILRGIIGHIFGWFRSKFRSKASCIAVSIAIIIGAASPYSNFISFCLVEPTCFLGGKYDFSSTSESENKAIVIQIIWIQWKTFHNSHIYSSNPPWPYILGHNVWACAIECSTGWELSISVWD